MANAWPTPHHHPVPPSPLNSPSLAIQWQSPTQLETNTAIQGCPCSICSKTRYNHQTAIRTIEYQDPQLPAGSIVPYMNQDVDGAHPTGLAAIVDGQSQAWSGALQALNQETAGYAPLPEAVGPIQTENDAAPDGAQDLNMSVPERLRRLAGHYVNNPESLINAVSVEAGPRGRFQVVIKIEIGDNLRDAVN